MVDDTQIIISEPEKVDSYTLKVRKDIVGMKMTFTRDYLVGQKKAILADLARYQSARQIELDEIDQLLVEMDKLGIVGKEVFIT